MVLSKKLNRSLKARREEDSDSEPHSSELDVSSPSILDTGEGGGDIQSSQSEDEEPDEEDEDLDEDDDDGEDVQGKLSKVSFGALAKVQASLTKEQGASRKRKRGVEASDEQEETLRTLRKRLEELKSKKKSKDTQVPKRAVRAQSSDESSDDNSDDEKPRNRSSKHAPTVQTTKKPVSRKRTVLETQKSTSRDPRFDPLSTAPPKNNSVSKKYSFLKDYRASEISALKTTLSKTKDPAQKETLKKQLLAIESRAKSQAAKDTAQGVIRAHRKNEKEAIEQGKKPFYLKKAEVREKALVQRFEGMSGKERDRALQRRQKKVAGREKKRMPMARRGV